MKKLILTFSLLTGSLLYMSCSSDDDKGGTSTGCVTCNISFEGGGNTKEVCNIDGIAYDDDYNTGIPYDEYVEGQESIGYNCN